MDKIQRETLEALHYAAVTELPRLSSALSGAFAQIPATPENKDVALVAHTTAVCALHDLLLLGSAVYVLNKDVERLMAEVGTLTVKVNKLIEGRTE